MSQSTAFDGALPRRHRRHPRPRPTPSSGDQERGRSRCRRPRATNCPDQAGRVPQRGDAARLPPTPARRTSSSWDTRTTTDGVEVDHRERRSTPPTTARPPGASSITVDNTAPSLAVTGGPTMRRPFGPGSTQQPDVRRLGRDELGRRRVPGGDRVLLAVLRRVQRRQHVALRDEPPRRQLHLRGPCARRGRPLRHDLDPVAIDATPPETTITSGPAAAPPRRTPRVCSAFSAGRGRLQFQCRVYPAALTPPAFASARPRTAHRPASTGDLLVRGARDRPLRQHGRVAGQADLHRDGPGLGTDPGTGTNTGRYQPAQHRQTPARPRRRPPPRPPRPPRGVRAPG